MRHRIATDFLMGGCACSAPPRLGRRQLYLSATGAIAVIKRLRQALQVHRGVADDDSAVTV